MALLPTFSILGSGPTVLMLHDADGDYLTFAPQVEMLASAGYRAVAWNMPGYGHSAPIEPYTFKGLAQSCVALIEALQCGPVTLVGHGMGAMLALEVAVRRAEVVNRLVLCAGGPALDAQAVQDWLAPRERALDAAQQPGGSMQQLAQTLVPQCIGPGALPEGVRLAERFATRGIDRWAGVEHRPGINGAPLLAGAAATFECFNRSQYKEGDHTIFVGEVERCEHREGASPLLYHGGKFYTEHPL